MFCQRCGKRNRPDAEACKFCKAPLLVIRQDRQSEAPELQPFLGIEDYVMDKISTVEKQAHRSSEDLNLLVQAVDFLERSAMVNRSGIHVLVQMLREKGLLDAVEFHRRWREKTLANLGGLLRKERFLDAKPHVLTAFKGKNRRRFEERLSRAEDLLYGFRSLDALSVLEEALVLDPGNSPLLAYLGEVYVGLGEHEKAMRCLTKVAPLEESPGALLSRVQIHLGRGETEEAEVLLHRALKKDSEDPDSLCLLALAKGMKGEWRRSQQAAEKALALEESPAALYLLAHALIRQSRMAAAEDTLDQLLASFPDSEDALLQKAMLLMAKGWWGRAREVLGRASATRPDLKGEELMERFRTAPAKERRASCAVGLDPAKVLAMMDALAEETSLYLGQADVETQNAL